MRARRTCDGKSKVHLVPSERTKSWLVIERLPEGKKGVPREVEGVETKVEATRPRPGVSL